MIFTHNLQCPADLFLQISILSLAAKLFAPLFAGPAECFRQRRQGGATLLTMEPVRVIPYL